MLLPAGWSFAASTGDVGAVNPSAGGGILADWIWASPPAGSISFTWTENVRTGTTGRVALVAGAEVRQSGATIPLLAQPAPLSLVTAATRRTADSDGDGKISLFRAHARD